MSGSVLIVDDEPSVGELVRGYLGRDGYRVRSGGGARRGRPKPVASSWPRDR
jgi:DNA-binding response OmpR family regulator